MSHLSDILRFEMISSTLQSEPSLGCDDPPIQERRVSMTQA
jgi:hypothetical protein